MRRALACFNLIFTTIFLCIIALAVSLFDSKGERIHGIARFWARLHLKICGITVSMRGLDNVNIPPYIFMCNHQSALDIFALLACLPLSFKWIAKKELFSIPFFGWAIKRAGYISLDRKNPRDAVKAMEKAAKRIRDGTNIIMFPEGTRSPDGRLLPFKKGSFSIVLKARVPVVPVGIKDTAKLQPRGNFIPKNTGTVYINIGNPINTGLGDSSGKKELMENVRYTIERLLSEPTSS